MVADDGAHLASARVDTFPLDADGHRAGDHLQVRQLGSGAQVDVSTQDGVTDVREVARLGAVEHDRRLDFRGVPDHATVAHETVASHVGCLAHFGVFPDHERPFEERARLEIEYIRHYRSSRDEMARDWHNAEVILASFLLEGKINFARQILPESYYHVEAVWLDELRLVTAYFHWLAEGRNLWNAEADFDYASTHIRERLLDPRVKASRWDFERVQGYVEEQYLAGGQLDLTAQAVVDLTTRKAYRLWEKTGESDSEANWLRAQGYVEAFYDNIVAAVTESNIDSIAAVLSALQVQAGPEHDTMINAFEALVAIYFLDPEVLQVQFGELLESVL